MNNREYVKETTIKHTRDVVNNIIYDSIEETEHLMNKYPETNTYTLEIKGVVYFIINAKCDIPLIKNMWNGSMMNITE